MKPFLHNAPKTRVIVSLLSIAFGGGVLGVCAPVVFANVSFFYGYVQAFTQGGGDAAFSTSATALLAAAAGGGLMIASGVFGLAGHLARSQVLLVVYLLLTFIGSLVAVVGGGMFIVVPSYVGEKVYDTDTNSISPPLQGVQRDVNDFTMALFNECCVAKNWTEQRAAVVCTGNNTADCPVIIDPIATDNIPNARTLLCSCAYSADKLASFGSSIQSTGLCAKATNAKINIVGLTLPSKVPGNIGLTTLTNQRYAGFKYTEIPLVGFQKIAQENPDQANAQQQPLPFGCGLGYMKGVAWMTDVWFKQNTQQASYGALALGLVNMACVVMAIVISILQNYEENEIAVGKVDKWDTVKDIPATFANTANPIHQGMNNQTVGFAMVVGESPHSSARNSLAQSAVGSGLNKEEVFEQLRGFYAKYDKGKNLSDVEDVASWTVSNGLAAINAKLMSKYKADLNTIDAPNSSTGLGSKALQQDLDI